MVISTPHPLQVENNATGIILRQGKGNLTRFMGGRKLRCVTEVSPSIGPNDRMKP